MNKRIPVIKFKNHKLMKRHIMLFIYHGQLRKGHIHKIKHKYYAQLSDGKIVSIKKVKLIFAKCALHHKYLCKKCDLLYFSKLI